MKRLTYQPSSYGRYGGVAVGDRVRDLGCRGRARSPEVFVVAAVFVWGLRLRHEEGCFDCEHWRVER